MNGKPETKHEGGYALDLCDAGRGAEEGAACGPLRPRSGGARAEKAYGGEGGTRAGTPGPLAQGREAPGLTLAQKEPRCAQAGGATPRAATGGACADAEGALPPGAAAGPRHGAARPEGRIGMAPQTKERHEPQSGDGASVTATGGHRPRGAGAPEYGRSEGWPVPILDNGHRIQSALTPLTFSEVYTNARMKIDPRSGECVEIVLASRPIFKAEDVEAREKVDREPSGITDPEAKARAARRAKSRLYDLCRFNDFDAFITLTLDDKKVNGYDYKAAVRKLGEWCGNRVQRRGLRYVIVPEKHPTSGRIHFHGLINSDAVRLEDSGHRDGAGRTVYNISDWGYGFTTAVLLDGTYEAVCRYVAKYMTKQENEDARGTLAGRYYYHGGDLREPGYIYFNALSADELGHEVKAVEIQGAGLTLRYFAPETSIK